jgi:probable HAF family extracellular repeat protein
MRRLACTFALTAVLSTALFLLAPDARAQGASFQGLGDLPGGSSFSQAFGVSADGSVVVGRSPGQNIGREAFRWTETGGMQALGDLPGGGFSSSAEGASADGSVVVGFGNSATNNEAFRWTQAGGMVGLGDLPGGDLLSEAYDVSADGSVVVGRGSSVPGLSEAFRWTQAGGMVGLGVLAGGNLSWAEGVSADGSVVVGIGNSSNGEEAFRWTAGGGIVGLGDLPGSLFSSRAHGVSGDGNVVVGHGLSANGQEAFRWTAAGGMVGLGDLDGGVFNSIANDVSADGSVVVGLGFTASGDEAFVWTAADGMRSLRDVLVAQGATIPAGWALDEATAVSADGRTVVGYGRNPQGETEAFRAVLAGAHRWIDPSGGSWDIASNWSTGTVPTEDDDVRFDLDATYTVTGSVPLGTAGARGGRRARRLAADDGLVDFDLAALTLTATTLSNPSLSVSFGARAKLISGTASAFDAVVGYGASTDSTVVSRLQVFNAGTVLDLSNILIVGLEGRGEVFVAAGDLDVSFATSIGGDVDLPATADGVGEVIVGNEGTLDTGTLSAGGDANGTLRVEEGGAVTARTAFVGGDEDVSGLVDVAGVAPSGARSRLLVTDTLFVNEPGVGEVAVRDGGEVTATGVLVGGDASSGFGSVTVSGVEAGERASLTANRLVVGEGRDGALTISAGGQVLVNDLVLGTAAGSALAAVFGTAGGFRSELVATKTGLSGSCLVGDSDEEATILFIHSGAYVRCDRAEVGDTGAGIVDVGNGNASDSLVVSRVLTLGAGAPGVLRLQPGAVLDAVDAPRDPPQDPFDVEVEPDGRIEGSGIVVGRIENEGFVGPGLILLAGAREVAQASPFEEAARGGSAGGTLLVRGAYVQGAGAMLEIPLAGPDTTQQGRLRVRPVPGEPALDGSAALDGRLLLFFQEGYAPQAGDDFEILDATAVSGDFDEVIVFGLEPGWEFEVEITGGGVVVHSLSEGYPTATEPDGPEAPSAFALHMPYPNPFDGRTTVGYDVAESGAVRLVVYDLLGREVAVLVDGPREAGHHEAVLDGSRLAAGVYLVRMTTEAGFTQVQRAALVR